MIVFLRKNIIHAFQERELLKLSQKPIYKIQF